MMEFKSGIAHGNDVQKIFKHAKKNKFALPAVNVSSTSTVNAVIETAADLNSPVIVQFSKGGGHFFAGKNLNNENILLGTGLVNFEKVFDALKDINYEGPYALETVRGSDPIKTAIYNMQLVEFFAGNAFSNV